MSQVRVSGNASGTGVLTVTSPNTNSNYTLTLPAVNGNLVSTGDTGTVTSTMLATAATPIGVGQTWQDLTASRALSTTYTNSTGRPIAVSVQNAANGSWSSALLVDSITVSGSYFISGGGTMTMFAVVPAGSTYRATASVALGSWLELR